MLTKFRKKIDHDFNLRSLIKSGLLALSLKIAGMIAGYLVVVFISRKNGPDGVGSYSLFLQFLILLSMIAGLGFSTSVLRYVGQYRNSSEKGKIRMLFNSVIILVLPASLTMSILLYLNSGFLTDFLKKGDDLFNMLVLIAFSLPFFTLNVIMVEFIRGLGNITSSEFLRSLFRPLLILFFMLLLDSKNIIYVVVISIITSFFLSLIILKLKIKKNENEEVRKIPNRELLKTSMPMMVTSVSFAFMDFIPLILIDYYTSTSQVGLYSVAYRITQFISITLLMVNTITAPIFADLYHSNRMIELQKIVRQSSKLIFFSALLIAIIILATNEGILFLFGKVFSGANLVLIILVLAQLINAFCGSSGLLLNMVGQQALFRNISLLSSFFLCVLCLIFIPLLGILGASISVLINMVIWNFLSSMYVYKKIKIKSYFTIY